MSSRDQILPHPVEGHPSGPQGTRLYSADELQQYAREVEPMPDGRASAEQPVLECIGAGVGGLRFNLHAGRQAIGRSTSNDIVLGDPNISDSHAWITGQHGRYSLMDTLSTNGTFVNGKRVHEAMLRHNDHIRFGQTEFVFLTREPSEDSPAHLRWILAGTLVLVGLAVLAWWFL